MNVEGYQDPTAEQAVRGASKAPEQVSELIRTFKAVAALAGYEITNRIYLKDQKTGRTYR
ncbi:hypothetical protein B6K86_08695 [Lachnospiraceae bacterium]|nr:hypothetical protein B6K86_08695 [Lachnospiraceae bacterium]